MYFYYTVHFVVILSPMIYFILLQSSLFSITNTIIYRYNLIQVSFVLVGTTKYACDSSLGLKRMEYVGA